MKYIRKFIYLFVILAINSCIVEFIPKTTEDKEILVVEGLVTNKQGSNFVKLSRSYPLGGQSAAKPVNDGVVYVTDDLSNNYSFGRTAEGTYTSADFVGVIGRKYTLHILANGIRYVSLPGEMLPVPEIDSLYYEKVTLERSSDNFPSKEGCQIYLDTHDPTDRTQFYRWEYSETWQFSLPYIVTNKTCWLSENSGVINVKNVSSLQENKINRFPLYFISNKSDRLNIKYSILVDQLSINEEEFYYWEKLYNLSEQVGGLYDVIPSSIPSNIYCSDDQNEKVLGYFSISASVSKRIFIKDHFNGQANLYTYCGSDTVPPGTSLPGLNSTVWIIINHGMPDPYWVITFSRECADCTARGTNIKPDFWDEGK